MILEHQDKKYHVLKSKNDVLIKNFNKVSIPCKNCYKQMETICQNPVQAEPQYIDCGEFQVPRYATCVCTTMCLMDYSLAYKNLAPENEDCKQWNSPKQKFEAKPYEEEDEDDEEEAKCGNLDEQ